MRIAPVAPGGVGGAFGGMLARAGEEVVAPARGAHLAAIREQGLLVEGPLGAAAPVPSGPATGQRNWAPRTSCSSP